MADDNVFQPKHADEAAQTAFMVVVPPAQPLSVTDAYQYLHAKVWHPEWLRNGQYEPRHRGIGSYSGRLENNKRPKPVLEL